MRRALRLAALTAAGLYLGLAQAAPAQSPQQRTNPDQGFLEQAARANAAEIELGKLARDRAQTRAVRDLAQLMINDRTRANKELLNLGDTKGLALPTRMDKKFQTLRDRLAELNGIEFDLEYLRRAVVPELVVTVGKFDAEVNGGQDGDVRNYANKTLPMLREHLRLARQLASKTKQP